MFEEASTLLFDTEASTGGTLVTLSLSKNLYLKLVSVNMKSIMSPCQTSLTGLQNGKISKSLCTDRECRAHAVPVGGHLPAQVGAVVHHRLVVEPEDVGWRLRGLDKIDI